MNTKKCKKKNRHTNQIFTADFIIEGFVLLFLRGMATVYLAKQQQKKKRNMIIYRRKRIISQHNAACLTKKQEESFCVSEYGMKRKKKITQK